MLIGVEGLLKLLNQQVAVTESSESRTILRINVGQLQVVLDGLTIVTGGGTELSHLVQVGHTEQSLLVLHVGALSSREVGGGGRGTGVHSSCLRRLGSNSLGLLSLGLKHGLLLLSGSSRSLGLLVQVAHALQLLLLQLLLVNLLVLQLLRLQVLKLLLLLRLGLLLQVVLLLELLDLGSLSELLGLSWLLLANALLVLLDHAAQLLLVLLQALHLLARLLGGLLQLLHEVHLMDVACAHVVLGAHLLLLELCGRVLALVLLSGTALGVLLGRSCEAWLLLADAALLLHSQVLLLHEVHLLLLLLGELLLGLLLLAQLLLLLEELLLLLLEE